VESQESLATRELVVFPESLEFLEYQVSLVQMVPAEFLETLVLAVHKEFKGLAVSLESPVPLDQQEHVVYLEWLVRAEFLGLQVLLVTQERAESVVSLELAEFPELKASRAYQVSQAWQAQLVLAESQVLLGPLVRAASRALLAGRRHRIT
jgi:hypothetical protein